MASWWSPVAYEIAKNRSLSLDVFLVRKLGTADHEELSMTASIRECGYIFPQASDEEVIELLGLMN